jgi:hypothetical protein
MCSKHVEAWNKLIIKFSASRWLILRNKSYTPFHPLERSSGKFSIEFWMVHKHVLVFSDKRKAPCPPSTQPSLYPIPTPHGGRAEAILVCVYVTYLPNLGFRRSGAEYRSWHSNAGLCNGIFSPSKTLFPSACTSRFSLPSTYFNTNTIYHAVKSAPSIHPTSSPVCTT